MSISEEREILLSQLVDGELPVDQANQVLADVFDELAHVLGSAEAGKKLNDMLHLRQALDPWRRQEPPKTIVAMPSATDKLPSPFGRGAGGEGSRDAQQARDILAISPPPALTLALSQRERGPHYWVLSLATAALLGGILVAGGFYLGGRHSLTPQGEPIARQSMVIVTPEQRQEIARAFTLHESVAGPLSWYASDDSTIQVAPAGKGETLRQPIAVVLRLVPVVQSRATGKTYVIVCRNSNAATIELPQSAVAKTVRLRLLPTASNGDVNLQYAIAADGSDRGPDDAALAGSRHVALSQTALGQLAVNNCLVNVDASAWVIKD